VSRPLSAFLIAGEASSDALGAKLMAALRAQGPVAFAGVGGEAMAREGLRTLFPCDEIAVGGVEIFWRLPHLLGRMRDAANAVLAERPDVLVIIDSPDFTHVVARRVRRARPELPIVNYVSPTVWAWRPGRAKRMRRYVDHVLALLPFEPEVHRRLGGPPCTYVGHPLIERTHTLRPGPGERAPVGAGPARLLVLPGSRRHEVSRLMPVFGETLRRIAEAVPVDAVLPAVPHLRAEILERLAAWPVRPRVVEGEDEKLAAFRSAHAALAASGTVSLELALAKVPMAVAYRLDPLAARLKFLVKVPSIVLPNLILGDNAIPEFLHEAATPENLAAAVLPLLRDGPERRRQLQAFARLDDLTTIGGEQPSERAARIVREVAGRRANQEPVALTLSPAPSPFVMPGLSEALADPGIHRAEPFAPSKPEGLMDCRVKPTPQGVAMTRRGGRSWT
jgi:lipid-A-disaccharide synthase